MLLRRIPAGDLDLDESRNLRWIRGAEQVRQAIFCRLKFFVGEWFADLREGTPYYQAILVSSPNLEIIRGIFRKVILGTPNVLALASLDLRREERTLFVSFVAKTTEGDVVVGPSSPFVVEY